MIFTSLKFGPRYALPRLESDPDGRFNQDRFSGSGSVPRISPLNAPSPTVLPTPTQNAQELAGGLTLAQLDQAARFETEEGASLNIDYGERLLAGALVSSDYDSVAPQNTFTVALFEGWGGLGQHGEGEGIVKAWYKGEPLTKRFDYTEWFRDKLPAGAVPSADEDGWNWVAKSPTPYLGKFSHQSPPLAGFHHHSFGNATTGLAVGTGDILSVWIWIDPVSTPTALMVEFFTGGSPEHRAYWGPNVFVNGTNGTPSRWHISASIPATGQWVRLDVPANLVAVEGTTLDGMGFVLHDGSATWGPVVRWKNTMSGNTGYVFRPGIIATDHQDIIQVQDLTTWKAGTANNGAAAATVRLSTAQSAEDRPDGFKCRAKCRRTFNFDHTGAEIDYGYSANPARVAADRVLHFFERRFRDNLTLARQKFRDRIYWPSWVEWRDFCDALIPWDRDGSGTNIFIKQFEAHIGINADLSLAAALDQITGLSATIWQDEGSKLIFLPPIDRPPVHHFDPSNIVGGGINISVVDLRRRANRFIARFRDLDDEFLGAASVEPPDFTPEHERRERAIARVGEIRSEREFPNMTFSQAYRLIEYRARLEHDNPVRYSFVGNAKAFRVLPGDEVTISHPQIEREYQRCLVTGIRLRSGQSSADEIGLELQRLDSARLYDKTYHSSRQEALTLP